jgi:alpha-glucosidase
VWLEDAERLALYLRPDELHTAFNFDFLSCPWDRNRLRASIDEALAIDATATWVLSNHDVTRPVTRYGREDTSFSFAAKREGVPTDLVRGERRARAAALLAMALPGSLYVYQGEELGLPEVEDIPHDRRRDPMWHRSNGVDPGRDGCRIPIPWSGDTPPYGFSPNGASPSWLEQPVNWGRLTVEAESSDPGSMLALYRAGLHLRREAPWGDASTITWLPSTVSVLAFTRGDGFVCVVNFGSEPIRLLPGHNVLIASNDLQGGVLPEDTTVWLRKETDQVNGKG